jgi:hypothetical protein
MEIKQVLKGFLAISMSFNNVSYYHGNLNYFITGVTLIFGENRCPWAYIADEVGYSSRVIDT